MLVTLAQRQAIVNTAELGKDMMVSPKYLRKLAGPLEKHGLIKSVQGIYGGYLLNRTPGEIKVADIFDAFSESIDIAGCLTENGCPLDAKCLTQPLWKHLGGIIQNEFYKITIKDILENNFPGIEA